jgi:hypothetical protein
MALNKNRGDFLHKVIIAWSTLCSPGRLLFLGRVSTIRYRDQSLARIGTSGGESDAG